MSGVFLLSINDGHMIRDDHLIINMSVGALGRRTEAAESKFCCQFLLVAVDEIV